MVNPLVVLDTKPSELGSRTWGPQYVELPPQALAAVVILPLGVVPTNCPRAVAAARGERMTNASATRQRSSVIAHPPLGTPSAHAPEAVRRTHPPRTQRTQFPK